MDAIVQTHGLSKRYGRFEAVRDLDLTVPAGTITGFLGQNGAGKSTTLKMLLGMVRPTGGTGTVFGHRIDDPKASLEIRRRVAYVAEDKRLYDYMTVGEMVRFTRAFFPGWRADLERRLLDEFNLPPERRVKKLSKGMRTQLALLLAFCRGADLLILDEPTEGLDPIVSEQVLRLVVELAGEGTAVFFSSHHVSEVEQVAEHVRMIDRGRLLMDAPLDRIRADYRRVDFVFDEPETAGELAPFAAAGVERMAVAGRTVSVLASGNVDGIIVEGLGRHALAFDVHPVSLKELLLGLLNR